MTLGLAAERAAPLRTIEQSILAQLPTVAKARALRWRTGQAMVLLAIARVLVRRARHVERAAGRMPRAQRIPHCVALGVRPASARSGLV